VLDGINLRYPYFRLSTFVVRLATSVTSVFFEDDTALIMFVMGFLMALNLLGLVWLVPFKTMKDNYVTGTRACGHGRDSPHVFTPAPPPTGVSFSVQVGQPLYFLILLDTERSWIFVGILGFVLLLVAARLVYNKRAAIRTKLARARVAVMTTQVAIRLRRRAKNNRVEPVDDSPPGDSPPDSKQAWGDQPKRAFTVNKVSLPTS
jgi:hypothetical protein